MQNCSLDSILTRVFSLVLKSEDSDERQKNAVHHGYVIEKLMGKL